MDNRNRLLISELKRLLLLAENDRLMCSDEQIDRAVSMLLHRPVSAYEAYTEVLHVSRSTFMQWVKEGRMPEGRPMRGFVEKVWYEDELHEAYDKIKQLQK